MPELGTITIGTTDLGTPSTETSATATATGARAEATGGTASLLADSTLTAQGVTATVASDGATLNIEDLTTAELGAGILGSGALGVAAKADVVTLAAQGTRATGRGGEANFLTTTTMSGTGVTASASTPGALLETISGGILGTGELGGGALGVGTGVSGTIMAAAGATATATGGGSAKLIDLDLPDVATGSRGWHVEVEHANGTVLQPELLDDPQFTPALKARPRVEIPVPRDEKWQSEAFDEANLSVWKDGRILPIDELVSVRMEPGRTVLVGQGGRVLGDRVQVEYDNKEAHEAARELGKQNTGYVMNVDDPATALQSDQLMQSGDSNSELRGHLNAPLDGDPVKIEDGRVKLLDSCWAMDTFEETSRNVDTLYIDDVPEQDHYSGGDAVGLRTVGSYIEYEFTNEYEIPAEHFWIAVRWEKDALERGPDIDVRLDGETLISREGSRGAQSLFWFGKGPNYRTSAWSNPSANVQPGTHTVRFEVTADGNADRVLDCVAPFDDRYNYTWDNDNGGDGGYLDGPEPKPDAHDVVFEDIATAFNVTAGQLDVVMDDLTGEQALALSNDRGSTYTSASNTDSLDVDFTDAGSSLRWKVTLSRYGSQDTTPKQGIHGQSVDSFELRADLEDTPVLTQQTYDGALIDVLNQIADYGNFIWELQRHAEDEWSIEWTQPGQRTADVDDDIADYEVEKSTERQYDRAVIKGANQPVRGERFTAIADEWVDLNQSYLVSATEIVRDPSSGETFELNRDFELDRQDGRIRVCSDGAMSDGTLYEIDYEYKTRGSYTADDAGDDLDELVKTVSSITSNRGCEQAALYLIRRIKDPLWEATVTVPTEEAGRSLVDDLALEGLPTRGERMEVREIEQTPSEVVLRLGSRQSVGEVLNDIESRISTVSERV